MYGKSGTIGEAGCGPTALAIAVASLTSNQVTPYDVAQWSVENGYRCEGNGSYHSLIPNGGAHYGLTVTGVGNDSKRLVDALKNGKLVIAIMSKGLHQLRPFYRSPGRDRGWKDPGGRSGQRKTEQSGMGAWNHPQ